MADSDLRHGVCWASSLFRWRGVLSAVLQPAPKKRKTARIGDVSTLFVLGHQTAGSVKGAFATQDLCRFEAWGYGASNCPQLEMPFFLWSQRPLPRCPFYEASWQLVCKMKLDVMFILHVMICWKYLCFALKNSGWHHIDVYRLIARHQIYRVHLCSKNQLNMWKMGPEQRQNDSETSPSNMRLQILAVLRRWGYRLAFRFGSGTIRHK